MPADSTSSRATADPLVRATRSLLTRFHRQRPVRAGSLLITIFGDSIAPRGGAVTLAGLIRLAEGFHLPERLVRTSVGRLAQEGWLSSRREGRQSEYFLSEHGKSRFAEATQRIYSEGAPPWNREWTLLLLPAGPGERLRQLREEMLWLGFGQVRPGVLAHPSRSVADARAQLEDLKLDAGVTLMTARSEGAEADRALIDAGWDLAELARSYQRFVSAFEPLRAALDAHRAVAPATAFVIRTLLIHEYRKIHLRDPLLPRSLLPEDWVGERAASLCHTLYRRVFSTADEHLSAVAGTLDGPLPPTSREALQRFGGIGRAGSR